MARAKRKDSNSKELVGFMDNFALKLRLYREEAGLSQNGLARLARISKATISDLESGVSSDVQFSTICSIALALKRWPIEFLIRPDLNLLSGDKKDFIKAYDELEKSVRVFRRLCKQLKG